MNMSTTIVSELSNYANIKKNENKLQDGQVSDHRQALVKVQA